MGTPQFIASWSEGHVTWGPPNLWLPPEVNTVLLGTVPLTSRVCTNSWWLALELHALFQVFCKYCKIHDPTGSFQRTLKGTLWEIRLEELKILSVYHQWKHRIEIALGYQLVILQSRKTPSGRRMLFPAGTITTVRGQGTGKTLQVHPTTHTWFGWRLWFQHSPVCVCVCACVCPAEELAHWHTRRNPRNLRFLPLSTLF